MIDTKRRVVLKGSLTVGAVGLAAAGLGLLTPGTVFADWSQAAFTAKTMDEGLKDLLGTASHEESDKIKITAPEIAENGAVVPVTVQADMDGIESISIIAPNNPTPLIASFDMGPGAIGFASTRIKMAKTGKVIAVAKVGDKLYSGSKEVKVTIGGCGG
jgi:sulfur-oxidizing protein SoxY